MIGYKEGQNGAFQDRPDFRDRPFSEVMGAAKVDWEKGFEIEPTLKVEDQNGSGSCVGQAFSKYAEVLNWYETGKMIDLSAKFIYGQIYLPSTGAYLRDAAKILVNKGDSLESVVPSYDRLKAPSERFMQDLVLDQLILDNALIYKGKEYRNVGIDIDEMALAIEAGHGMAFAATGTNPGWATADVRKPLPGENKWGHAIYAIGYGMRNGKKAIKFINSWGTGWGESGYGWMNEDYFTQTETAPGIFTPLYIFQGWTIIDKINENDMKLKKERGSAHIYAIINNNASMIIDMRTLKALGLSLADLEEVDVISETKVGTLAFFERIIE